MPYIICCFSFMPLVTDVPVTQQCEPSHHCKSPVVPSCSASLISAASGIVLSASHTDSSASDGCTQSTQVMLNNLCTTYMSSVSTSASYGGIPCTSILQPVASACTFTYYSTVTHNSVQTLSYPTTPPTTVNITLPTTTVAHTGAKRKFDQEYDS